jgi:hypothetical protein
MNGSSIWMWRKDESRTALYGSCLRRANLARESGVIAGVLFFQGETDARDPMAMPEKHPNAAGWGDEFKTMARMLRGDLGLPSLPFVFAQIGTTTDPAGFPNWEAVRTAQATVAMQGVAMITTADLPLRDSVHFTSAAQDVIGQRFAAAVAAQ